MAQSQPGPPSVAETQRIADIEHRLDAVTDTLVQTQRALQKSLLEIQSLRGQIDTLRAQNAGAADDSDESRAPQISSDTSAAGNLSRPLQDDLQTLREEEEAMQAEIAQHEQIKVESASKYPLRLTGLVLFNAFSNAGVVDNVDLPTLALPRQPGHSHGSAGATMQQTLLGLEATGRSLPAPAASPMSAWISLGAPRRMSMAMHIRRALCACARRRSAWTGITPRCRRRIRCR